MTNLVRTQIYISDLEQGMTVEYNGQILTVSKRDVKRNDFMGYSFRGDASKKQITRLEFAVPTLKGLQLR